MSQGSDPMSLNQGPDCSGKADPSGQRRVFWLPVLLRPWFSRQLAVQREMSSRVRTQGRSQRQLIRHCVRGLSSQKVSHSMIRLNSGTPRAASGRPRREFRDRPLSVRVKVFRM